MKVALVYDRVNKFGGAERLVRSIHDIYPEAPLYTLVHNKETSKWAKHIKVIPTFLNKISFLRSRHEWLAPVAPMAFETLDLSEFDVVISITSSDAKAVITSPKQLHICYCLTPTRYYWSGEDEYKKDFKLRIIPKFLRNYFRTVDLLISNRPDEYIAISDEVKKRIKKYYNRESSVVFPPIEDKFYSSDIDDNRIKDYYLIVSRLVPYKKTELAIKAFNKSQKKLIIVGEGSELTKLREMAMPNITFVGKVKDSALIDYYRSAKALIFPQDEDFGLVPLEAQASGTPVIAFGKGGALETVVSGKTGLFFKKQSTKSLCKAVEKFEGMTFFEKDCIENAKKFNIQTFSILFSDKVNTLWEKYLIQKH